MTPEAFKFLKSQFPLRFTQLPDVRDKVVIEGAQKWIGMVKQQQFCPFVNGFGDNRQIVIERKAKTFSLLALANALQRGKKPDVYVVVLPTMPLPIFGQRVPNIAAQGSLVMGDVYANYRHQIAKSGINIIDVPFNPFFMGTASWSPWPMILLMKKSIVMAADEHVPKSRQRYEQCSGMHPITASNYRKIHHIKEDPALLKEFTKSLYSCYGSNIPYAYYRREIV